VEPLGGEVRRELDRFGPEAAIADVVAAWPAAVGPTIARSAWPARVARDGTLHVATASSAWAYELSQLAPTVLETLRLSLGDRAPAALRFAVGPLPEPGAEAADGGARAPVEAGPEQRELAAALTADVADPELRALVARAAAASLSRGPGDRSV
jgi:hypothetical protein